MPCSAHAGQTAALQVRGAATIAASARASAGLLEVRGTLTDDAGRALGQSQLRVLLLNRSGKSQALQAPQKCPPTTAIELSRGFSSADAYVLQTDAMGSFCVRVGDAFDTAKVELRFEDDTELLEAASIVLPVETARHSLELAFSPAPTALNLGQRTHTLFVDTQLKPPLAPQQTRDAIKLSLLLSEEAATPKRLVTTTLQPGTRGQFEVPSNKLGQPGQAKLTVSFQGSERIQPADVTAVIARTAQVELSMPQSSDVGSWVSGTTLFVAVGYVGGAVPGGSVEARVMGQTVGIAPVKAGAASVPVRVESSRRQMVAVTLHYLPDSPWWIPGPPLEAQVATVSPASWVRWTWVLLAGLVAGWTAWAWRRPRQRRAKRDSDLASVPPGKAKLEVVRKVSDHSGWVGRVVDAHDGLPIREAELRIIGPSFQKVDGLRTAWSGADGGFEVASIPTPWPEGVMLRVSAAHHATLERALPVEGEIVIHLTTRRRALLERLARWVDRRGAPYKGAIEPTPGEVAATARSHEEPIVNEWARGVEDAAYGASPPDAVVERSLIEREPGS